MRAAQILLEYDREKTLTNFRQKLVKRMPNYDIAYVSPGVARNAFLNDRFVNDIEFQNDILDRTIRRFELYDPTNGNKFVPAMVKWYIESKFRLEDLARMKDALITYVKFKNRIKGLNLMQVRFEDFELQMDEMSLELSGSEQDKAEEQAFYDRDEAELIHNDDELKIVIPKTIAASCYFGRNTKWCTAARDKNDNMFYQYASTNEIYVILFKKQNMRWQWWFGDEDDEPQFMDERDDSLNSQEVRRSRPAQILRAKMAENLNRCPKIIQWMPAPFSVEEADLAFNTSHKTYFDIMRAVNAGELKVSTEKVTEWTETAILTDPYNIRHAPQTEANCLLAVYMVTSAHGRNFGLTVLNGIKDDDMFMKMCMVAAVRDADVLGSFINTVKARKIRHGPLEVVSVAFHPKTIRSCPGYPDEQKMEAERAMRGGAGYDMLKDIYNKVMDAQMNAVAKVTDVRHVLDEVIQHTVLKKFGLPGPRDDLLKWTKPITFKPQRV